MTIILSNFWGKIMATTKCGWCGTNTHMTVFGSGKRSVPVSGGLQNLPRIQGAFLCDQCGCLSIGSYWAGNIPNAMSDVGMAQFWSQQAPRAWSPSFVEGQVFEDVPTHIQNAASEAYKGASIGNFMSAILMARTVIEASAKEVGITDQKLSLLRKIDEMAKQSLLREDTKEAAHAVRQFGNDMAHGDIADPVDGDDAEEVLILMSEVLNELFQGPARTKALKAKVAARKSP